MADDKPAFDPSKPFESADKPPFDPSKPFESAEKPMTAGETTADVAKSFPTGVGKGLIGLAGLPGDISAVTRANEPAPPKHDDSLYGKAVGYLEKARSALELPTSSGIQKGVESVTGPLYKPKTALGEYAQTAGEFAPAVVGGEGSLVSRALTRAAVPALGAEAAQAVAPEPLKPYAKVAGALATGVGAAGVAGAVRAAREPMANVSADLSRAMLRDSDTPETLTQRLTELQQVRPNATLADAAGENVRGIVERIAQTPGAGRTTVNPALSARQTNQAQRLSTDLADLTGSRQSAFSATQDAMAARSEAAAPLYRQAYEEGDRAIWNPELERLSGAPMVQRAMRQAVNGWQNTAIADGYGAMNPAKVDRGGLLTFPRGSVPAFPSLQFWDYTKQALDQAARSAVPGTRTYRNLTTFARQMRTSLDQESPTYSAARQSWSGPSQYMDAIEEGRGILTRNFTAEELNSHLAEMTDAQREAYRLGAVSAIRNQMRSNPAKFADMTRLLRSPEMREKLSAIMPTPEAAENFQRRLDYEIRSSELTNRALGNSATARRQAEQDQADGLATELTMAMLSHGSHGVLSFLRGSLTAVPQRIRDTLRSRSDSILADLLVNPQGAGRVQQVMQGVGAPRTPALGAATVPALTYGESGQRASGGRVGFNPSSIGARKAKNGHWFLPDPNRPGKFLHVLPKKLGHARRLRPSAG